jgi:regulatory protein
MDEAELHRKKYSAEIAWQKICKWCAFQERSQQEVRDKLYDYGLHQGEVEPMISRLITENFLNEERFAIAFAGGKFRQLGWGRVKIKLALKQKKVSDYCIRKAMMSISENDYLRQMEKVLAKRAKEEKEKTPFKRQHKLAAYLISRGFEPDLVWDLLKNSET